MVVARYYLAMMFCCGAMIGWLSYGQIGKNVVLGIAVIGFTVAWVKWIKHSGEGDCPMPNPFCPTASGEPAEDVTFRCRFEWKPQDLWIGAFWKRLGNSVDVWICVIPCVPLHLCWHWRDPAQ